MQLESKQFDDAILVTVDSERIDAACAVQFKDRMRELTADGPARVVLDMHMADFVDSSGLGAIIAAMKQLALGQVIELAGMGPSVEKVFRLTRMDTIFTIHKSADAAFVGMRKTG